ncbi:hypothetical protein [Vallitalea guaymasensis]|uniref:hypothetical protein n=1 Tax=Vallitalea guaymasensis TaxID=1185412 RepID=UPI000DE2609B|nr:hypothetical protein [Vallitalea guaymasensis]
MNEKSTDKLENLILESIEESVINYPDDIRIDDTINTLKQYMPNKLEKQKNKEKIPLLQKLRKDISLVSPFYWLLSFTIYIIGLSLTLISKTPYITISFFSPIPFIIMFFEDIKSRENNVLEMELACKYSPQVIILNKIITIIFYNLLVMSSISLIIYYVMPDTTFFNLLITWLTPMLVVSNITLYMIKKIRTSFALSAILLIWLAFIMWIINTPTVVDKLYTLNTFIYIGIIIVTTVLLIIQLRDYINENSERSVLFGA